MSKDDPALRMIGRRLGPYEILGILGRGGMGVVFRARQMALGRDVALKFLLGGSLATEEARARFINEARLAARLQHPGLLRVFDAGVFEDQVYYAMDLVEGTALGAFIDRVPAKDLAAILAHVATTLQAVHDQGLVHRDVKPANIMIRQDGQPLLMDFGLAKDLGAEKGLTVEGSVLGTPAYMAPEQAGGEISRIDHRVDIYALGAVLYHGLVRRPPFEGPTTMNVITKVISGPPPPPSAAAAGVPEPLERICLRAMARDPADRYPRAAEMAADLARFARGAASGRLPSAAKGTSGRAVAATAPEEPPIPRRRLRSVALGGAGVLAVLIVGSLVISGLGSPPPGPAAPAGPGPGGATPAPAPARGPGDLTRDEMDSVARTLALPAGTWFELDERQAALRDLIDRFGDRLPDTVQDVYDRGERDVRERRDERAAAVRRLERAALDGDQDDARGAERALADGRLEPLPPATRALHLSVARLMAAADPFAAWEDLSLLAARSPAPLVDAARSRLAERVERALLDELTRAREAARAGDVPSAERHLARLDGGGDPFERFVAAHGEEIEAVREACRRRPDPEPVPAVGPMDAPFLDRCAATVRALSFRRLPRATEAAGPPSERFPNLRAPVDAIAIFLEEARAGAEAARGSALTVREMSGRLAGTSTNGVVLDVTGWRILVPWEAIPASVLVPLASRRGRPAHPEVVERAERWLRLLDADGDPAALLDACVGDLVPAGAEPPSPDAAAEIRWAILLAGARALSERGRPEGAARLLAGAAAAGAPAAEVAAVEATLAPADPGTPAFAARFRAAVAGGEIDRAEALARPLQGPTEDYVQGVIERMGGNERRADRAFGRALEEDPGFDPVAAGLLPEDGFTAIPLAGRAILLPDGRTRVAYDFDDPAEARDWFFYCHDTWTVADGRLRFTGSAAWGQNLLGVTLCRVPFARLDRATFDVLHDPAIPFPGPRIEIRPQADIIPRDPLAVEATREGSRFLRGPPGSSIAAPIAPGVPFRLDIVLGAMSLALESGDHRTEAPGPPPRVAGGGPQIVANHGTDLDRVVLLGTLVDRPAHPADLRFEEVAPDLREVPLPSLALEPHGDRGTARCDGRRVDMRVNGPCAWGFLNDHAQFLLFPETSAPFELTAVVEPGIVATDQAGLAVITEDGRYLRYTGSLMWAAPQPAGIVVPVEYAADPAVPPVALRLRRAGNLYWAERSEDGERWTPMVPGALVLAGEVVRPALYFATDQQGEVGIRFSNVRYRVGRR